MKILAIEKETKDVDWSKAADILKQEAMSVYNLQQQNIVREIYFNEQKCAVLILECKDKTEASLLLSSLPLVKNKFIHFELHELQPYSGFERLFHK